MRYFTFLTLVFFWSFTIAQEMTLSKELVSSIEKRVQSGVNPAIVIGIIDKDGTKYYSFGKTKLDGKKVNEHTIFELGSISKVFTGILLADMVVKGKLNTNDPIQQYLPAGVKVPEYDGKQITLGHLSDHTSSLPRMPDNFAPADFHNPYADYTVQQMYDFLSSYSLTRPIGSQYEYSNFAVGLLGHILALQASTTYEDLMVSKIADPLSMNDTRVRFTKRMKKNLAAGHQNGIEVANWDIPTLAGAGGIRSSVHDMVLFLSANLGLVKHPLYEAMLLSHMPRHDKLPEGRVGLGWHIVKGTEGDMYLHNGATGGYITFAGFVKETGRGVVVLSNSTESVEDIGMHLLDPNTPLRSILPHIAGELKNTIDLEGYAELEATYDEFKKEKQDQFDFSEEGINSLGYYYLNRKKTEEALAVFKLNMREYPASFNVYDSYAEGLMEKGDTSNSIIYYQKSLELNPGNTNAVTMLAKMGVQAMEPDVSVNDSLLQSYVGTYQIAPGFVLMITTEGGHLFGQATGQMKYEIYPMSDSSFYYKVVDAQVTFHINGSGEITHLTLQQNGRNIEARKLIVTEETPIEVEEATLDKYVGTYVITDGFEIAITKKEKRLFTRATGQPEVEMFARSPSAFFLKAVPATITFISNGLGEVTSLKIDQNGQSIEALKRK